MHAAASPQARPPWCVLCGDRHTMSLQGVILGRVCLLIQNTTKVISTRGQHDRHSNPRRPPQSPGRGPAAACHVGSAQSTKNDPVNPAHQVQAAKGALGACSCGPASGGCTCADPVRVVCSSCHQLRISHAWPTHLCRGGYEDVAAVVAFSHDFSTLCRSSPRTCRVAFLHETLSSGQPQPAEKQILCREAASASPPT